MTTQMLESTETIQNEEARRAAGELAHDLNNCLTAILGGISLAQIYTQKGMLEMAQAARKACSEAIEVTLGKYPKELDRIIDGIREALVFAKTNLGFITEILSTEDAEPYLREAEQYGNKAKSLANKLLGLSMGKEVSFVLEVADTKDATPKPEEEIVYDTGRILLMDDDEAVLKVLAEMIRGFGYEVITASEGREAIRLFQEGGFDLVILDLKNAKGLDGPATMAQLLSLDPDVIAIAISGYYSEPVMEKFADYGFKGAVVKPPDRARFSKYLSGLMLGSRGTH